MHISNINCSPVICLLCCVTLNPLPISLNQRGNKHVTYCADEIYSSNPNKNKIIVSMQISKCLYVNREAAVDDDDDDDDDYEPGVDDEDGDSAQDTDNDDDGEDGETDEDPTKTKIYSADTDEEEDDEEEENIKRTAPKNAKKKKRLVLEDEEDEDVTTMEDTAGVEETVNELELHLDADDEEDGNEEKMNQGKHLRLSLEKGSPARYNVW